MSASTETPTPTSTIEPTVTAASVAAQATAILKAALGTLTIEELTQGVNAVTPALTNLSTGDGTESSIMGDWLQLQGAVVGNAAIFQKIGVNVFATAILAELNAALAEAQALVNSGAAA